nr:biotin/lipoyl-binding protein [Pseudophaeobacter flagellatus]
MELFICSLLTVFPDFLYRRFVQGKRLGQEINFFSVWYELRWGITMCIVLTVSLITVIFYFHPATRQVGSYFRTMTILSERGGRVAEVHVKNNQHVEAGDILFRLDDSSQKAAVETARTKVAEIEASLRLAAADLKAAEAGIVQAQAVLTQATEDLDRNLELRRRGSSAVRETEIERLENLVARRQGELEAAQARESSVRENIAVYIPAQRASAEAALHQAKVELAKSTVVAGVSGRVEQFGLQVGDIVNPILRPAGILVPDTFVDQERFVAGFGQITANVIKPGMYAEIGCLSKPFTIIPMIVVEVQDVIPAGQIRPTDVLRDPQDNARPGTLTVFLEPLYEGQADDIPPGSSCLANAYTNNHDRLSDPDLGLGTWIALHVVDTVGLVHALLLRLQMLLMPVQTLVFTGH